MTTAAGSLQQHILRVLPDRRSKVSTETTSDTAGTEKEALLGMAGWCPSPPDGWSSGAAVVSVA